MNEKIKMQKIIDENIDAAEMGCSTSRGLIVMAQAELDKIAERDRLECWAMVNRQDEDEDGCLQAALA